MLHQPRQCPATILIVDDEPVQLRAIGNTPPNLRHAAGDFMDKEPD